MKKVLSIIISILVGIGIGYTIELIIMGFSGNDMVISEQFINEYGLFNAKLIHTIIYGGFGLVGYLSSFVYELEKISLLFATILNLSINIFYFVLVGIYLKWFNPSEVIFSIIGFTITYFIIWTSIYFSEKVKIENINKKLNKNR